MAISAKMMVAAVGSAVMLSAGYAHADRERSYVGPYDPGYVEHPYVAPGLGYAYPEYDNSGRYYRDRDGRWRERQRRDARSERDANVWPNGMEPRAQGDIARGTGKDYDYKQDVGQNSGG